MKDAIIVKGTRVHNLQDIDVEIPRNELVVITGSAMCPSCYKCLPLIAGAARAATLRVLTASVSLPGQRVR